VTRQAAQPLQGVGPGGALDRAAREKERGLGDPVDEGVDQRGGHAQHGGPVEHVARGPGVVARHDARRHAQREDDEPDLADRGVREHVVEAVPRDGGDATEDDRRGGDRHQQRPVECHRGVDRHPGAGEVGGGEHGEVQPDDGVDADLLHDAGEHRGDRGGRGTVRAGHPELERHQAGLQGEHAKQQRRYPQDGRDGDAERLRRGQATGHVGHVQRARGGVQAADGDQHQRRGDEVEHDVLQAGAGVFRPGVEHDEHVGGHQHHLEPDEQVEQVAGEKGARDADQREVKQRVEGQLLGTVADVEDGVDQRRHRHDGGDDQHERRETVGDGDDPDRRRPVAQAVHQAWRRGLEEDAPDDQRDGTGVGQHADDADRPPGATGDEQGHHRRHQGDEHRGDDDRRAGDGGGVGLQDCGDGTRHADPSSSVTSMVPCSW